MSFSALRRILIDQACLESLDCLARLLWHHRLCTLATQSGRKRREGSDERLAHPIRAFRWSTISLVSLIGAKWSVTSLRASAHSTWPSCGQRRPRPPRGPPTWLDSALAPCSAESEAQGDRGLNW